MQLIPDSRISYDGSLHKARCIGCDALIESRYRSTIRNALNRGTCKHCKKDYRDSGDVRKSEDGKWLSSCPQCGREQKYTRKDHACSSSRQGWTCRRCATSNKNYPVGNEARLYNKFRKSANNRGIEWKLDMESFIEAFDGRCALTGWPISMDYSENTASLDRIDSAKGYYPDNIQWVHVMVNMCKNKYNQDQFVAMCEAVANKVKW